MGVAKLLKQWIGSGFSTSKRTLFQTIPPFSKSMQRTRRAMCSETKDISGPTFFFWVPLSIAVVSQTRVPVTTGDE